MDILEKELPKLLKRVADFSTDFLSSDKTLKIALSKAYTFLPIFVRVIVTEESGTGRRFSEALLRPIMA